MKIVDNRAKKEEWHLGDVLVSKIGDLKGLILKTRNEKYCLIDITPDNSGNYSAMEGYYGDSCENLAELYSKMSDSWHKVNAKLVIE